MAMQKGLVCYSNQTASRDLHKADRNQHPFIFWLCYCTGVEVKQNFYDWCEEALEWLRWEQNPLRSLFMVNLVDQNQRSLANHLHQIIIQNHRCWPSQEFRTFWIIPAFYQSFLFALRKRNIFKESGSIFLSICCSST